MRVLWTVSGYHLRENSVYTEAEARELLFKPLDITSATITSYIFFIFSLLTVLNVLFVSVVAFAATVPIPYQNLLPDSLIPRLSMDGNTLVNGMPLKAVINDLNPAAPLRKILAPMGLMAMPGAGTASFSITYIADGGFEACWATLGSDNTLGCSG